MRNARVVAFAGLQDARVRRREGLHLAEGVRVCREALARAEVVELFLTEGIELAVDARAVRVTRVAPSVMARLSDAVTPPGVLAVVRTPPVDVPIPASGPVLVLDQVSDPGNVGTLVRSATAFGATVVMLGGADPFGPKAVRASAGTCYRARITRADDPGDLGAALHGDGRPVLGLAADGATALEEVGRIAAPTGRVLVVGSEPHGLGGGVRHLVDGLVRIPMAEGVESLNVAAAGAIAMYALMGGAMTTSPQSS